MKLKHLLIKAKRQVFSQTVGNNPSRFKGEGYDFVELRQYQVGDDIKHIDWNITAKMQSPYVKVFREERELNIALVSMMGGSLYFGAKRLKQETVTEIVALLGFSAVKNADLLSQYVVQDEVVKSFKASKRNVAVYQGVEFVANLEILQKDANYENVGKLLMQTIRKKSLIIIIGDFFEIPELKILAKKHEVVAILVRDRLEENPQAFGHASLIDPQSGMQLEGNFGKSKVAAYAKKVAKHDEQLLEHFKKSQIRHTKIYNDENPYMKLSKLFGQL